MIKWSNKMKQKAYIFDADLIYFEVAKGYY